MDILKKADEIRERAEHLEKQYGYDKYTAYRIASQEVMKVKGEDE